MGKGGRVCFRKKILLAKEECGDFSKPPRESKEICDNP